MFFLYATGFPFTDVDVVVTEVVLPNHLENSYKEVGAWLDRIMDWKGLGYPVAWTRGDFLFWQEGVTPVLWQPLTKLNPKDFFYEDPMNKGAWKPLSLFWDNLPKDLSAWLWAEWSAQPKPSKFLISYEKEHFRRWPEKARK